MSAPSPLLRALGAARGTGVTVTLTERDDSNPVHLADDTTITGITIRRGGDDDYDVLPHVLTLEITGSTLLYTGRQITVAVASPFGPNQTRFRGIVGPLTMTDRAGKMTSSLTANTWTVMLDKYNQPVDNLAGTWAQTVYDMMDLTSTGIEYEVIIGDSLQTGSVSLDPGTRYSDAMTDITGSGVAVLTRRSGNASVVSHVDRAAIVAERAARELTLPRSACKSPTEWRQPIEQWSRQQRIIYGDSVGTLRTKDSTIVPEDLTLAPETHEYEWWRVPGSSPLLRWVDVLAERARSRVWTLPQIEVPLLPLLNSPMQARQALAQWLLAMQPGDPVPLGADWGELAGWHFATGLDETIGPRDWTLTLTLSPHARVTGLPSPAVTGRTWDTLAGTWNAQTFAWNAA